MAMSDSSNRLEDKDKKVSYTVPLPLYVKMGANGDGIVITDGRFTLKIAIERFSQITLLGHGSISFTIEEREPSDHGPLVALPKMDLFKKGYKILGKTETPKTVYVYYKRHSDRSYYFEAISQRGTDRRFLGSLNKSNSKIAMALALIDKHFLRQPFSLADARAVMRSYRGLRHSLTTKAIIEVLVLENFLRKLEEKDKRGSELYVRISEQRPLISVYSQKTN